ncbi:MAG: glycosyltransferase involved in cell wall biosynthesis [Cryomorphaceae bacterium]|jgi:glycosyltransferase involved in cell wall biosynthesis
MKFPTIIPVYNKQATLRWALYSTLDQVGVAHQDHQIIIIDDGSSDAFLDLAKQFKLENRHRNIDLYVQENGGVSSARNRGIALASHELVTFLDADDTYTPNFLSEISQTIDKFPTAHVWATSYNFVSTSAGTKQGVNLSGLTESDYQLIDDFFISAATGDPPITSSSVCINKESLLAGWRISTRAANGRVPICMVLACTTRPSCHL